MIISSSSYNNIIAYKLDKTSSNHISVRNFLYYASIFDYYYYFQFLYPPFIS